MRCHQHLGGRLRFSLNISNGAVFFCGVSRSRLNTSISAQLFFVPNKSVNHAYIGGGSLYYQVRLLGEISVLFFVTLFRPICSISDISLLPKRLT